MVADKADDDIIPASRGGIVRDIIRGMKGRRFLLPATAQKTGDHIN